MNHNFSGSRRRGFSLVELVIVIVVLGILSAVVITNIGAKTQHSVTTQADQFRRNLSHLQLLAISQGARLKLVVTPATLPTPDSYSVCLADVVTCDSSTALPDDPVSGGRFSVNLTDGVKFTDPAVATPYYFDSLGRPVQDATGSALVSGTTTFKLNGVGRATPVTVTVLPITGFAQTNY